MCLDKFIEIYFKDPKNNYKSKYDQIMVDIKDCMDKKDINDKIKILQTLKVTNQARWNDSWGELPISLASLVSSVVAVVISILTNIAGIIGDFGQGDKCSIIPEIILEIIIMIIMIITFFFVIYCIRKMISIGKNRSDYTMITMLLEEYEKELKEKSKILSNPNW